MLGVPPGRTTVGQTGATLVTPLDDLDLADLVFANGTEGDRLRDGGKVDDDILTDTDYTDYTDTDTRNKLTRSDCLITLTNSMTEIKSVTIARSYDVVSLRTVKQSTSSIQSRIASSVQLICVAQNPGGSKLY